MLGSPESYRHVLACWRDEQDKADAARSLLESQGWLLVAPGTPWLQLAAWPSTSHAKCGDGGDLSLR
jgi:hypothetical protein